MRIATLLPSATEIVCELGLGESLVAVTHECDYPPWVQTLPKVTQTLIPTEASSRDIDALVREQIRAERALYSLDLPVLERLGPDLIVTQTLCDVCAVAGVAAAAARLTSRPRVVNLEPRTLAEVLAGLQQVGEAAGAAQQAHEALARLNARVAAVERRSAGLTQRPRVVFLEWLEPLFCAGHWTPELVHLAGGVEAIGRVADASRTTRWDEVVAAEPDVLFTACCGFTAERARQDLPLLAAHPGFADLPAVRTNRVYISDGNAYFSRPGPRLVDSLEILAHALHPQVHPLPSGLPAASQAYGATTLSG